MSIDTNKVKFLKKKKKNCTKLYCSKMTKVLVSLLAMTESDIFFISAKK